MTSRMQSSLMERGLDGYVANTYQGVYYTSGIRSATLKLFPRDAQVYAVIRTHDIEHPVIVAGRGDMDTVAARGPRYTGIGYGSFFRSVEPDAKLTDIEQRLVSWGVEAESAASPAEALARALNLLGLQSGSVGFEDLGQSIVEQATSRLPGIKLTAAPEVLKSARLRKSPQEQELLSRAAVITEDAIGAAVALARDGVTEREMLVAFQRHLVENGADPVLAFIRFGRNGGVSQVQADSTPLQRGDLIWFDVCADYEGYKSDIARTFALGDPGQRARTYYSALKTAEDAMIDAARPGRRASEIFDLCVQAARDAGIPNYRRHHVGHAIGMDVYETPLLAPGQDTILEEEMVLNVEAPYYEIGFGALHVEDPIVVGTGGGRLLSKGNRELVIL
jgi:Xaa-Pro aminopeptidase